MHVSPRKDMLIDPTSSGSVSPSAQPATKHSNQEGEADAETASRTKMYIYYGQSDKFLNLKHMGDAQLVLFSQAAMQGPARPWRIIYWMRRLATASRRRLRS